ncbi:AmpG family muropeptide MFS transporter [Candidatus Nucleicultrix amoebiphila]|jgi:PAT family beta-lactamase induction signal transducer AmpG|uniref:AmpG family muropeptide MFS transporter n=1 Tax=Candidatus Nucleicultrix amoebiphila TaxID=1509244 RepID=UPI000A26D401|nr:MFS transporter [Candidatus Nucleicultrix amoebiphila]
MNRWQKTRELFRDPRISAIFLLSISSGLPFFLTLSTLHARLSESGISKTNIGLFVLLTLPYSFKFLWAPIIDAIRLPILSDLFGHRKSWLFLSQVALIVSLISLGTVNPAESIVLTALFTFLAAFCSASQDIVIEAYRVEIAHDHLAGPAASASVLGYRLGLWASGAGALYVAAHYNWLTAYGFMACAIGIGIVANILSPEPIQNKIEHRSSRKVIPLSFYRQKSKNIWQRSFELFINAFVSLKDRQNWVVLVLFILFYKMSDTLLNVMSVPFLLELGFSKLEIAHVAKSFGIGAMILGGVVGGFMLSRHPIFNTLVFCGILQILSSLMFMVQAYLGYNLGVLFMTIGLENLACGIGTAAFITYLSGLCSAPFTASQYALLSSFASFARVLFSSGCGWLADQTSWPVFYGFGIFACLPFFILILSQKSAFKEQIDIPQSLQKAS